MRKTFTLVELLIVVTIISVLTGAAMPYVNEYLESARSAKATSDLDEIARAIMAFEAQTGTEYNDTNGDVLRGRYLQKIPLDPWGSQYSFTSATDAQGAVVRSSGPDLVLGSDDDIIIPYKGKLAIVSTKWFDANGDGVISKSSQSYPATDTFLVRFNRGVKDDITTQQAASNWGFYQTGAGASTFAAVFTIGGVGSIASITRSSDGKQLTFLMNDAAHSEVTLGKSVFKILAPQNVLDLQGKPSVSASSTVLAR